jgi:Gly-Xaa carboxypeptidase
MPKGYNTSVILGEKDRIVKWLSEAVKIPTEVFDIMGPVDEDPKWQVMPPFHDCKLKSLFPADWQSWRKASLLCRSLDGTKLMS